QFPVEGGVAFAKRSVRGADGGLAGFRKVVADKVGGRTPLLTQYPHRALHLLFERGEKDASGFLCDHRKNVQKQKGRNGRSAKRTKGPFDIHAGIRKVNERMYDKGYRGIGTGDR